MIIRLRGVLDLVLFRQNRGDCRVWPRLPAKPVRPACRTLTSVSLEPRQPDNKLLDKEPNDQRGITSRRSLRNRNPRGVTRVNLRLTERDKLLSESTQTVGTGESNRDLLTCDQPVDLQPSQMLNPATAAAPQPLCQATHCFRFRRSGAYTTMRYVASHTGLFPSSSRV